MDWKNRLIDILFEAKAVLKPNAEAGAEHSGRAKKAANRAMTRAFGTKLPTLRTASGDSSRERKGAERAAAEREQRNDQWNRPVTPARAEIISGRRPSPNQPHDTSQLKGVKGNERQAFKRDVIDTEKQRVIQRNSPDPAPAHKGRQAALKSRLKAKFSTGKTTQKP